MDGVLGAAVVAVLGLAAWSQVRPWLSVRGVTPRQLERWLEEGPVVVADLRSPEEFERAHLPGAISVPWVRVPQRSRVWAPDQRLVLVCRTGSRSLQAVRFLQSRRFRDVHWLRGGMLGWAGWRVRHPGRVGDGRAAGRGEHV